MRKPKDATRGPKHSDSCIFAKRSAGTSPPTIASPASDPARRSPALSPEIAPDGPADYDSLDEADGDADHVVKPVVKQEAVAVLLTPASSGGTSSAVADEVSPKPAAMIAQRTKIPLSDFLATLAGADPVVARLLDARLAAVLVDGGVEDSSTSLLDFYRAGVLEPLLRDLQADKVIKAVQRTTLIDKLGRL